MQVRLTDDPKPSAVILVGIVGTIVLVALIVAGSALYDAAIRAEEDRTIYGAGGIPAEYTALRNSQLAEIESYRWVDQQNGVVGLPIEEAMQLTVADLRAQQGGSSVTAALESD
jgi:hypothetical protein